MLRRILLVAPLLDPPLICSFPCPLPFLPLLNWISANIQSKTYKSPFIWSYLSIEFNYIFKGITCPVLVYSVYGIFFPVRISIHQIHNLTMAGYTLEVLDLGDYIYYVIIYGVFILVKQHNYLPPKSPSPSLCARDFMWAAWIWVSFKK